MTSVLRTRPAYLSIGACSRHGSDVDDFDAELRVVGCEAHSNFGLVNRRRRRDFQMGVQVFRQTHIDLVDVAIGLPRAGYWRTVSWRGSWRIGIMRWR